MPKWRRLRVRRKGVLIASSRASFMETILAIWDKNWKIKIFTNTNFESHRRNIVLPLSVQIREGRNLIFRRYYNIQHKLIHRRRRRETNTVVKNGINCKSDWLRFSKKVQTTVGLSEKNYSEGKEEETMLEVTFLVKCWRTK